MGMVAEGCVWGFKVRTTAIIFGCKPNIAYEMNGGETTFLSNELVPF